MSTAETSTAIAFLVGQTVLFNGYSPDGEGNMPDPLVLQKDERVTIDKEQTDGSFVVYSLRTNDDGSKIGDAAFPEELRHTGDPADLEVGKKPKAKAGDKKAKAAETPAVGVADKAEKVKAETKPKASKASGNKKVAEVPMAKTQTTAGFEASEEEIAAQAGRPSTVEGEGDQTEEQTLPGGVKLDEKSRDVAVITITDSAAVKKILAESKDVIEAAKTLAKRSQQNDFALGGVLNHIRDTGIWKTVTDALGAPYEGKRGFTQFIKDHLDVDYRKAMYLIGIYTIFRRLGQDEKSLDAMGWSKAKELAALGRLQNEDGEEVGFKELEEHFDELSAYAANHSREDLVAKIAKDHVPATTDTVTITKFNFKLSGSAAELANNALAAAEAKVEGDDNKKNSAFEYIMADWLMHNSDMSMNDVIASVQNKYGVRLTVSPLADGEQIEQDEDEEQTVSA